MVHPRPRGSAPRLEFGSVATLLADPPAAPPSEQPPAPESSGAPCPHLSPDAAAERHCEKCGASMEPAQEWCLQCGAVAPGSLATRSPSWRSSAVDPRRGRAARAGSGDCRLRGADQDQSAPCASIVQVPAKATARGARPRRRSPPPRRPRLRRSRPRPHPRFPRPRSNRRRSRRPRPRPKATTPIPTTHDSESDSENDSENSPERPTPPHNCRPRSCSTRTPSPPTTPKATPRKPSATRAWRSTATPPPAGPRGSNPAIAPKMAVGLLIDLNTPQKLSALAAHHRHARHDRAGVRGSTAATAPTTITDPAWTPLSAVKLHKERPHAHQTERLRPRPSAS